MFFLMPNIQDNEKWNSYCQQDGFALMIQLGRKVCGRWWVADSKYLYPACWGWIKKILFIRTILGKTNRHIGP